MNKSPFIVYIPDGLDPDDWIKRDGNEPFLEAAQNSEKLLQFHYKNYAGDVNSDGLINVLDVVNIINFILSINIPVGDQFILSDINQDDVINVLDVVLIVNIILNI